MGRPTPFTPCTKMHIGIALTASSAAMDPPRESLELREDGDIELREAGDFELRDEGTPVGINTVPENEDSDGDTPGLDVGTIIYDGGFSGQPGIGNSGNGKKITGTSTDFAKFLFSIGVPVPGTTYTMTYDPDFSLLTLTGKLAMVGFGFRQGSKYHLTGLRGDGSTGLNAYKAYGNNFGKLEATSSEDGGATTHGTQAGAELASNLNCF